MDDSPANYREAYREEAETIAAFQAALALETEGLSLDPDACLRGVRAVFDDPAKGRYYLARVGRVIAGCLLVTTEWSDWRAGTVWWIHSVYVLPDYRGRKLFSGLYGFVRALADLDVSVRGIRLYVEKKNKSAKKVYDALGFDGGHYDLYEWMKTY